MADTIVKQTAGTLALDAGSSTAAHAREVAKQAVRQPYTLTVDGSELGAAAENILIAVAEADITVTRLRTVSSINVATNANKPEFDLAKGDLAAGSLTQVGEFIDLTATALTARTVVDVTTMNSASVTAGQGLYLDVQTNGTPADISEDVRLTFIVEWEYAD